MKGYPISIDTSLILKACLFLDIDGVSPVEIPL